MRRIYILYPFYKKRLRSQKKFNMKQIFPIFANFVTREKTRIYGMFLRRQLGRSLNREDICLVIDI